MARMTRLVSGSDSRKLVVVIFRIKLDLRFLLGQFFRVPRHNRRGGGLDGREGGAVNGDQDKTRRGGQSGVNEQKQLANDTDEVARNCLEIEKKQTAQRMKWWSRRPQLIEGRGGM